MFYNPRMALDRDLGVAVVRALRREGAELRTGWEMTAATGVRGLRLVAEGGPFAEFVFTERHREALEVLRANAAAYPEARVVAGDARTPIAGGPFDWVDLDPYGTPEPFVDAALATVRDGGTLAVTATDMMVLAGPQAEVCRKRYGASPVRGRLGPEGGLRILLAFLDRRARVGGRWLAPRLSYVHNHHVRTYVTVRSGPPEERRVAEVDPASWEGPPLAGRGPLGPLWLGPLFDEGFVRGLDLPPTAARPEQLRRLIDVVREEAVVDVPFYYEPNTLARTLRLPRPPSRDLLCRALRSRGFRAARTHVRPEGVRTDASRAEVERVVRSLDTAGQSQNARVRA